jgi:hypothetical protein
VAAAVAIVVAHIDVVVVGAIVEHAFCGLPTFGQKAIDRETFGRQILKINL